MCIFFFFGGASLGCFFFVCGFWLFFLAICGFRGGFWGVSDSPRLEAHSSAVDEIPEEALPAAPHLGRCSLLVHAAYCGRFEVAVFGCGLVRRKRL